MRKLTLLLAIGLLAAGCGGTSTTTEAPQADVTQSPAVSDASDSSTESLPESQPDSSDASGQTEAPPASEAPPATSFDGPPAPDFELALADGSTFALSAEQKPVYMVFWAEW